LTVNHYVMRLEQYQWLTLFVRIHAENLRVIHTFRTACLDMAALTCAGDFTTFRDGRRHLMKTGITDEPWRK